MRNTVSDRSSSLATRARIYQSVVGLVLSGAFAPMASHAADSAATGILEEITVTARRKDESALNVPVSVTAFSEAALEKLNVNSFTDYATKTPNLAFSYGTANWGYVDSHTIAIRGISGFGTTGVYIDDTPVPDSTDPRVLDIARIEVLKGPQGTLFGQSSLGGNLRLVTVQADPEHTDGHYSVKVGKTSNAGSDDYSLDGAGTVALIDHTLALRAVGFYDHEGGYLNRQVVDPNTGLISKTVNDYGATESYGGSLSLKWIVNDRLDVNLRFLMQQSTSDGWSAPYASLTNFAIQSFTMQRTNDVQEQAKDQFYLPSLQINYKGDGYSIKQSLSYFDRIATQVEDGSEGTRDALVVDWMGGFPAIAALDNNWMSGPGTNTRNQAFPWQETVSYRRLTSETQWSLDKTAGGFSAISGVYLSHSYSNTYLNGGSLPLIQNLGINTDAGVGGSYCGNGTQTCSTYGSGLVWESNQPMFHNDAAIFGEMYQQFGQTELTLGGRFYDQRQDGNEYAAGALNFAQLNLKVPDTEQKGFNPKVAIKYNFDPTAMVYASFSKGFRSGGAGVPLPTGPAGFFDAIGQKPNTPTTYTSDYVKNYEIGGKWQTAGGRVDITGALFQMDWTNIQQTIIAPVTYITLIVNAGDARVRGGELEINAKATDAIDVHAGVGYTDAQIVRGALYWQPTGSAVYNTPKVTANASVSYTAPVTDTLSSFVSLDGSYTSSSYSGTAGCQLNTTNTPFFPCPQASPTDDTGVAPQRAGFTVANLRFGLDWGRSELALYVQNLTNAHPNLGDFNPESYAKHSTDPSNFDAAFGTGYIIPRVATLRPLNIGLTFRQKF